MLKRVLVVDADPAFWGDIRRTCEFLSQLQFAGDFTAARRSLFEHAPDILVTNLRLAAYNGLHLVHLASARFGSTRSIVFSHYPDAPLFEEAQHLGAFIEQPQRLAPALPAYLQSMLPTSDRRSWFGIDRRQAFRGGRRAGDLGATLISSV